MSNAGQCGLLVVGVGHAGIAHVAGGDGWG